MEWGWDRLRRPAYTGENRCTPCTVLNLLVAAAASSALAVVSPAVGVLSFVGSVILVYLRGYLVPGTPTITARYVPERVLELFGKETVTVERDDRTDDGLLAACGAVERSSSDDRRLTSSFRTAWNDRLRDDGGRDPARDGGLGVDDENLGREAVAGLFGVEADAVSAPGADRYLVENERLVQWPSDAALLADVAASRMLRDRCPEWAEQGVEARLDALTALRSLREDCPACGGPLSRAEETIDSCCQPPVEVVSVCCEECGASIAETRVE